MNSVTIKVVYFSRYSQRLMYLKDYFENLEHLEKSVQDQLDNLHCILNEYHFYNNKYNEAKNCE